ncbi:DSS1/SEM1 family-domain-containing protein [Xylariales sp. PMI_506]|nr:DSS1/SEM1 family-domain-containing protein [Xylariales sp. PMI_506]
MSHRLARAKSFLNGSAPSSSRGWKLRVESSKSLIAYMRAVVGYIGSTGNAAVAVTRLLPGRTRWVSEKLFEAPPLSDRGSSAETLESSGDLENRGGRRRRNLRKLSILAKKAPPAEKWHPELRPVQHTSLAQQPRASVSPICQHIITSSISQFIISLPTTTRHTPQAHARGTRSTSHTLRSPARSCRNITNTCTSESPLVIVMASSTDKPTTAPAANAEKPEQAQSAQKSAAALEEDDEFEDFPVEDWPASETEAAAQQESSISENAGPSAADNHLWEKSWDDDDTSDDFSAQLREELKKVEASKRR